MNEGVNCFCRLHFIAQSRGGGATKCILLALLNSFAIDDGPIKQSHSDRGALYFYVLFALGQNERFDRIFLCCVKGTRHCRCNMVRSLHIIFFLFVCVFQSLGPFAWFYLHSHYFIHAEQGVLCKRLYSSYKWMWCISFVGLFYYPVLCRKGFRVKNEEQLIKLVFLKSARNQKVWWW